MRKNKDGEFGEIPEYKQRIAVQTGRRSEPMKKWKLAVIIVAVLILAALGSVVAIDEEVKYAPTDIVSPSGIGKEEEAADNGQDGQEPVGNENREDFLEDTKVVSPEAQSLEDQVINLLLIGEEGIYDDGWGRSDTSIILTINKEQKTLKLTSLMRDILVEIPGYLDNKLNAAFRNGGGKLLTETV